MKETLFEIEPTLSPFNQWKKDNNVVTHYSDDFPGESEYYKWCACIGGDWANQVPEECGWGQTEMEACYDLTRWLHHDLPWFQKIK